MSYLIEHPETAERCHVGDLDGYPGWIVLGEGPACCPKEHAEWRGGKWVVDHKAKREAERKAKLRARPRDEVIDELQAQIDELRAEIRALKAS